MWPSRRGCCRCTIHRFIHHSILPVPAAVAAGHARAWFFFATALPSNCAASMPQRCRRRPPLEKGVGGFLAAALSLPNTAYRLLHTSKAGAASVRRMLCMQQIHDTKIALALQRCAGSRCCATSVKQQRQNRDTEVAPTHCRSFQCAVFSFQWQRPTYRRTDHRRTGVLTTDAPVTDHRCTGH